MATQVKHNAASGAAIDRFFGEAGFLGVDFTSAPELVDRARFSDCANMWRDYESGAGFAVETFPGFRRLYDFGARIYGIFHFFTPSDPLHREYAVVHAGNALYLVFDEAEQPQKLYADMAAHDSVGFVTGDALWILDGTNYVKLFYEKESGAFVAKAVWNTYIPLTFRNGAPYEQRNALSDCFKEGFDILEPSQYSLETDGLLYEVTDPDALLCEVMKIQDKREEITIPSSVVLGGQTYTVTGVGARAFQNDNSVRRVTVQKGVESIGDFAFNTCLSLEEVFLPSTIKKIGWGAFAY
ncbi:MAG: leucine-rich repeat protein, partial [Clostridia bacterium]|nr:leucine-rich repeat protein [Clostridia bacterium]